MFYEIKKIDNPKYLHLKVSGDYNQKTSGEILDEIIKRLSESQHNLLLMDVRGMEVESSIFMEFTDAEEAARKLLGKAHKIASVCDKETEEFVSFFEMVACNRGVNVKMFYNEQEAIDWFNGVSGISQNA